MSAIAYKVLSFHIPLGIEMPVAFICLDMNWIYAQAHNITGAVLFMLQIAFGILRYRINNEELKKLKRQNKSTDEKPN